MHGTCPDAIPLRVKAALTSRVPECCVLHDISLIIGSEDIFSRSNLFLHQVTNSIVPRRPFDIKRCCVGKQRVVNSWHASKGRSNTWIWPCGVLELETYRSVLIPG